MKRAWILWTLAIVFTLSSVIYQRMTGPTRPVRGTVEIASEKVDFKLLRTHVTVEDALMKITTINKNISGELRIRRYKSHDKWRTEPLERLGDKLVFSIPKQPSAGKVMYQVRLFDDTGVGVDLTDEPVIIRFKGPVPIYVIIPHVIFIFSAMLLSTRAGLEAIKKRETTYKLALWTTGLFLIGGLIMGPIVQKFAFGAFWTGWPFGHDLTDNKTIVAWLCWVVAIWRDRKTTKGNTWYIGAAVMTTIIFLIPHSALGSELDYTKLPPGQ